MQTLRRGLLKLQTSQEAENRRVILELLEPDESARVLDLGSGDGSFTIQLGNRIGTHELFAVEIVEKFVQQCQARGIRAYVGSLNDPLALDNEAFDVVHANQVLEHLNQTDLFIREILRVLRRGGYAIISTPNLAAWHNIASLFLGWQPFSAMLSDEINVGNPLLTTYKMKAAGGLYPVHRRIPTYRGLRELLVYHGFKIEKMVGVCYPPLPIWLSRIASYLDPRHAGVLTVKVRKR